MADLRIPFFLQSYAPAYLQALQATFFWRNTAKCIYAHLYLEKYGKACLHTSLLLEKYVPTYFHTLVFSSKGGRQRKGHTRTEVRSVRILFIYRLLNRSPMSGSFIVKRGMKKYVQGLSLRFFGLMGCPLVPSEGLYWDVF